MTLQDFLAQISILEPVDYKRLPSGTEVCYMRVHNTDAWMHMFGQVLIAQSRERKDVVSVSKEYLVRGTAVVYAWKVIVKDLGWFIERLPRTDRIADQQRNFVQNIDPATGLGTVSLLGMPKGFSPSPKTPGGGRGGVSATATASMKGD